MRSLLNMTLTENMISWIKTENSVEGQNFSEQCYYSRTPHIFLLFILLLEGVFFLLWLIQET